MATNIFTGQKNVTTSGTPVQLPTQIVEIDQIILLKAKRANTGTITVGSSSANALNGGSGHYKLEAGQSIEIRATNTNLIWIDATVNGEGIEYFVGASGGGGSSSSSVSGTPTDGTASPSGTAHYSYNMGFNGTTWDRIKAGITTIASTFTGFLNSLPWGIYHATPTTRTDGQGGPIETDSAGNIRTREQYAPGYEDNVNLVAKVEQRFSYATVSTATTTVVKSGAGFLHAITLLGGTAGAITVYDNTTNSGTTICPTFTPGSVSTPVTVTLDEAFATGCTIVTAAATVLNISYR